MNKFDIITYDQATIPVDRKVDTIVVHHSASLFYTDAAIIDKWHNNKGWNGIGYHYVVNRNGDIQVGRPVEKQGAHVKHHNAHSIGVCFIGNFSYTDPMTLAGSKQFIQGALLVKHLQELWRGREGNIIEPRILGHREMPGAATECPGKLVKMDLMRSYFDYVHEHREAMG